MKFLIQWTLVLSTLFQPIIASAALTDFDRQEISFKNFLAPYNSGFESGKAQWTASGGTLAVVTSGSNLLDGKTSITWDASASGQTLSSKAVTLEKGYFGRNCSAEIVTQVPSGTATHSIQAYDGTNILATATIVSSTLPYNNVVNFPCPQSGTVLLRAYANADEPLIAADLSYIGLARNVGSTQLISEWTSYTPTVTNLGTGSLVTNSGYWRRVGNSAEVTIKATKDGSAGSGAFAVGWTVPSQCTIDSAQLPSTSFQQVGTATDASYGMTASVLYLTSSTVYLYAMTETVGQFNGSSFLANKQISLKFSVPCVGWQAQTIVMPDAQGWFVDASIAGANPDLGVANVSSYTEITNGSLTMTPKTGSAAAGIMCNSTNAAATPTTSTSTCSAGSESVGINASVPRSGAYEVCVSFSHYTEADQAEGVNTAFQLVRTATNAQTILEEGGSRPSSRNAPLAVATGTSQAINFPYNTCGIFQLSAGVNGFRLMYEQLVAGTPNGSQVLADGLSTVGQRDVRFTIKPVSQQQSAVLANSVSTGTVNGEKIERAKLNLSGATTVSITNQSTGWLQSVTASGTVPTLTFTSGWFSAEPTCNVTCSTNVSNVFGVAVPSGTTSVNVACIDTTGAVRQSNAIAVTCMGPR